MEQWNWDCTGRERDSRMGVTGKRAIGDLSVRVFARVHDRPVAPSLHSAQGLWEPAMVMVA